jgi:hypothetical protein
MTRLTRQCSSTIWRHLQRLTTRSNTRPRATTSAPFALTALVAAIVTATGALMLPAAAAAQEARGTITGTIRDTSGSVIPGATVTITNKEMGTTVTVVTNEVGFYQAPYLIPGVYQVNAELQGFKKAAREVELRIADRLEIDLGLAVGETVESVTVTRGASRSCPRPMAILTLSSAWPRASPIPARPGSTDRSSPRTSSATRWTARAATAAT